MLQQLQPQHPPAYLLEDDVPLSHRPRTKMREDVFPLITSVVGQPVSLDAALAGSYAHRLRDYWSNLFQNHQFNMVMAKESRCTPALPTILATHNSWAFRAPRPDTVIRSGDVLEEGETREVNLDEKAIAMGYSADELRRTDGMDDEKLAEVLGLAMDRRAMELLFLVAEASATGLPVSTECQDAGDSSTHATPMEAMIRAKEWELEPLNLEEYRRRHHTLFVEIGGKPLSGRQRSS
ncbi:hypothetical protein CYMTET_42858 [Cymbomonas tetramitiformis]|uniref:Uncharacterized protein n=1 Tax=Cymbomonas tetramitiformis TaxID=36881 RepID=A0AAE0C4G4_9CHLO|nr:hypothetical protein CYMTET_42858 [Cymbomonas tetramitiformis]